MTTICAIDFGAWVFTFLTVTARVSGTAFTPKIGQSTNPFGCTPLIVTHQMAFGLRSLAWIDSMTWIHLLQVKNTVQYQYR